LVAIEADGRVVVVVVVVEEKKLTIVN